MRLIPLVALLVLWAVVPAQARDRGAAEAEILHDFEQILDLWRDGRYGELYERTSGRDSKELLGKKLASAPRRPACCWEKMQEARVTMKGERSAVVRARLGFEGAVPGTEFETRAVKLNKEGDLWHISQTDLFSLGNLSKKRARYKYLPIQVNK